jgi:hypothetical protein
MKTLRLSEVLLPLLAARAWAPWPVEPGVRRVRKRPSRPAAARPLWQEREPRRLPFDDVQ